MHCTLHIFLHGPPILNLAPWMGVLVSFCVLEVPSESKLGVLNLSQHTWLTNSDQSHWPVYQVNRSRQVTHLCMTRHEIPRSAFFCSVFIFLQVALFWASLTFCALRCTSSRHTAPLFSDDIIQQFWPELAVEAATKWGMRVISAELHWLIDNQDC